MHRVNPKQVQQEIMAEIAEEISGELPKRALPEPGDHLKLGCEIVGDVLVLSTACITNDHLLPLYQLIRERAAQVGVDLED